MTDLPTAYDLEVIDLMKWYEQGIITSGEYLTLMDELNERYGL